MWLGQAQTQQWWIDFPFRQSQIYKNLYALKGNLLLALQVMEAV